MRMEASDVVPVRIGPNLYYVERSGEVMGEYSLSPDYIDVYQTNNMTYLSDHILDSGVKEMALQRYPDQVIWCVRNDGVLATLTREVQNKVQSWTRQVFTGTDVAVENVAVIPNGSTDQVWVVVKRTINSVTRRYVEYFDAGDFATKADSFYVQSGLTYSGASTTALTGLDHLEGEEVSILGDGAVHPNQTVTNGALTLTIAVTKAHVGLPYTSTIRTMDVEMANEQGTAQSRVKTLNRVFVRLYSSLGMLVGTEDSQDVVPFRDSSMDMDDSPNLFTGDKEVPLPSGHARNKHVVIKQEQPLPLHVLGIYVRMKVSP